MESRYVLHIKRCQIGRTDDLVLDHLDGTVANLKELIRDLINVPVDQQQISIRECGMIHVLEDKDTLSSYYITNNSVIHLEVGCFIPLETGYGTFLYQDDGSETVENLKKKLCYRLAPPYTYPVDQQNVFFGKQVLEDQRTLSSYGVHNKSILHIKLHKTDCCVIITSSDEEPTILSLDHLDGTVEGLKADICATKGYPVNQINLIFRDQVLQDERTLSSYGIQHKSPIHLELRARFVVIKISTERPTAIYLDHFMGTVENLKAMIFEQEGYPKENQKLIFRHQTLEDRATLSSSGVYNGGIVHLELNKCLVLIKTATGRPNFLQDNLSETVEDLKRKIHALTGHQENQQELICRGKVLDKEQCSLSSYGIRNDSAIHFVLGVLFVHIQTLTGKTLFIHLDGLDVMVKDLKAKIQDLDGVPDDQQRLIFSGRQLEDNRILSDYGIQRGSIIHLILRLRGGDEGPDRVIRLGETERSTTSSQDRSGDFFCLHAVQFRVFFFNLKAIRNNYQNFLHSKCKKGASLQGIFILF